MRPAAFGTFRREDTNGRNERKEAMLAVSSYWIEGEWVEGEAKGCLGVLEECNGLSDGLELISVDFDSEDPLAESKWR